MFGGGFGGYVGDNSFTNLTNFEFSGVLKVSKDLSFYPNLSKKSLVNLIDCLYDSSTPLRLTLGKSNLDRLTQEEIDIARRKNWTLS